MFEFKNHLTTTTDRLQRCDQVWALTEFWITAGDIAKLSSAHCAHVKELVFL